jgi:RNA polymerase subunit RPABC4/transcription elongation factor Spt4
MKRMLKQPMHPDPWDQKIAAEIGREEATPLCHRCLTAHDSATDFCPACGAAVGQYTNWLPYPQLFSIGHALRIGTSGKFRRSPLTVSFFLLFSLVECTLFAPIYWIFMALKLGKHREHDQPHDRSSTASSEANS